MMMMLTSNVSWRRWRFTTALFILLVLAISSSAKGRQSSTGSSSIHLTSTEWEEMYQAAELSAMVYLPKLTKSQKGLEQLKVEYKLDFLEAWEIVPDQAMVAKVKGLDACFGVFRGTDSFDPTIEDWEQNFSPYNRNVHGCKVRSGYYDAYNAPYRSQFESSLDRCINTQCDGDGPNKKKCKMILTGHSQGGSIAVVASLIYRHQNPIVITFGAPKVVLKPCQYIDPNNHYRFISVQQNDDITGSNHYDIASMFDSEADHFGKTILWGTQSKPVPAYLGLNDRKTRIPSTGVMNHFTPFYITRIKKVRDDLRKRDANSIRIGKWYNGYLCGYGDECISGRCAGIAPPYHCRPKAKVLESCVWDTDCESNKCLLRSTKLVCAQPDGKIPNGGPCDIGSHCASGRCEGWVPPYTCRPRLKALEACNENSDCESNKCLLRSTQMKCALSNGKMPNGGPCDLNHHCDSGRCEGYVPPYNCHARLNRGRTCNEDSDCKSRKCKGDKWKPWRSKKCK